VAVVEEDSTPTIADAVTAAVESEITEVVDEIEGPPEFNPNEKELDF